MKTKSYDVYEFSELSDDAKEKAIDELRYINVEDLFWYDYEGKTGFSSAKIKKYRLNLERSDDLLKYKNLYFDIGRAWYIQFDKPEFADDETARRFLGVPKKLWEQVYWSFENRSYGGNCHGTTRLTYEAQAWDKEFTTKQTEILNRAVERFSDKMEEALRGLRDYYEYLTTEEAIIETIESKNYEFTIDGKID